MRPILDPDHCLIEKPFAGSFSPTSEAPSRTSRAGRKWRAIRASRAMAPLLAFALIALTGACHDRWDKYQWRASSGSWGLPSSGTLDQEGVSDLLLHTNEEANPWVVIDMLKPREVKSIVIYNRVDCCQERGLPMVVEVGETESSFVEVGRRTTKFYEWDVTFTSRSARYVRIRSEGTTILHLREIQIP